MNMFCRLKLKKGVTIIFSSPVSVTHNTYFMHITYEWVNHSTIRLVKNDDTITFYVYLF